MNLLTESKTAVKVPLSPETAIALDDVSVRYRVPSERINTFKEYMIRWMQRKITNQDFWALHHVNLEVRKGEVFGLVGRNGAGKSTLLKVIAKVLRPTAGRVRVVGHVVPLLELGAGFHPELTGRENIFLNGAMLGYTRAQMEEKFPRIVDFSELGSFIDAPVRTYSSGMYARLGFAIAVDDQPDILIVDEILGVGDEAFQRKCSARIDEYRVQGATILVVSHSAALIEAICQRAAWLDHGEVRALGTAVEVLDQYHRYQA
jgi:ABC-type polysaccharide/polyol phosphate transport system ATPase subunit